MSILMTLSLPMLSNDTWTDKDDLLWIELAKLYRSINDYDSIKGIFMKKSTLTSDFTKNGLLHESNNDFHRARICYQNGLESSNTENSSKRVKVVLEL